jgi:uncharacterized protein YfiM (DUF2279 family)
VRKWLFQIFICLSLPCFAQHTIIADTTILQKNDAARKWLVGGSSVLGYGISIYFFNEAWYKDFPRTAFHTYNDAGEWKQMDKVGHAWATYNSSRIVSSMWRWAGVDQKAAVLLGTGSSLLYMTSIEYLDGLSADWGWSWPDVGMNVFGASLFAAQELGWKEQRMQLKFSAHKKNYRDPGLEARVNQLYGSSLPERLLKDYNAQSYWLSFNLGSVLQNNKMPAWLNLAIGYGAEGMFGGYENIGFDKNGNLNFDRRDIPRTRQWYLSPDIDLTRIKTNSKFLRSAFYVLNMVKIPAPALELSNKKLKLNLVTF